MNKEIVKTKVTSKHENFTLNEKAAIQKMLFEKIRRQIVRSVQENTNLEHVENEVQKGQVYSEILRVKDKNARGQWEIFTINIY